MLRGEGTREGTTGGREGSIEATSFSTPLRFATWNCCGLSNVTVSQCKDMGFDILALTETHGWCADTSAIYSDDPAANDKHSGCRIVLSPLARRAVTHTGSIRIRIVFARIRGRPFNIFIICVYVPHQTASKMLSRITGRTMADEARQPSVDVLMRARDQSWNWLGHILRMEGHRLTRQVLLQCVKATPESILGDVPGLEVQAAIN